MYLRRHGWTDADSFSIQTAAGEIRPTITSTTECTVDMGRATRASPGYPSGAEDGRGELEAAGRTWRFQYVQVGNPQCAIRVDDERELAQLDLQAIGPEIEHHELFPNRTNVSWFAELDAPRPDPRADLRARRGGDVGERHGRDRGGGGVRARRRTLAGDGRARRRRAEGRGRRGPHIKLTGWAVPVFRARSPTTFLEELHATK